jgi:intracellular sulfur oxidation DsrE/DsrF family protein
MPRTLLLIGLSPFTIKIAATAKVIQGIKFLICRHTRQRLKLAAAQMFSFVEIHQHQAGVLQKVCRQDQLD